MQLCSLWVFALCAASAAAASVSAESAARLWLSQHGAPNSDELAELRSVNPQAYAIVKALLTKRSLGLLDPKHPTASFSKVVPQASVDHGPEVYEKLASPGELHHHMAAVSTVAQVDMPYAEVQPAPHRDWLNWKPQTSATDDETMVQNVLGAVAELKGKKAGLLSQSHSEQENSLSSDEASFGAAAAAAPVIDAPVAPVAAPAKKAGGYIDFDLMVKGASDTPPSSAPAKKENSYLNGLDLMGDSDAQSAHTEPVTTKSLRASSTSNALESFSWDDEKPAIQEKPKPKFIAPKEDSQDGTLMSWLGGGKVQKEPVAQKVEAPAKAVNPYILDLSN